MRRISRDRGRPLTLRSSCDLGTWHVVVLDDSCIERITPGCDEKLQEQWLKADLAAHPTGCEPRYSSGNIHGDLEPLEAFWNPLYQAGVDLVLNGSEHDYEGFAPQDAGRNADPLYGMREIVVGTGGESHYALGTLQPNSIVYDNTTVGVLKVTLHPGSYDWQFLPVAGGTFTDSGTGTCHSAPPAPPPATPTVRAVLQASGNAVTSLAISVPSGTAAGDLLVAELAHQGGTACAVPAPSGWTAVPGSDVADATNTRLHAYTHVANSSEPASYTFMLTGCGGQDTAGAILDVVGGKAPPAGGATGQANTTASTDMPAPSLTTTAASALLVYAGATPINSWAEPPPFMAAQAHQATTGTYKLTSKSQPNPPPPSAPPARAPATSSTTRPAASPRSSRSRRNNDRAVAVLNVRQTPLRPQVRSCRTETRTRRNAADSTLPASAPRARQSDHVDRAI